MKNTDKQIQTHKYRVNTKERDSTAFSFLSFYAYVVKRGVQYLHTKNKVGKGMPLAKTYAVTSMINMITHVTICFTDHIPVRQFFLKKTTQQTTHTDHIPVPSLFPTHTILSLYIILTMALYFVHTLF